MRLLEIPVNLSGKAPSPLSPAYVFPVPFMSCHHHFLSSVANTPAVYRWLNTGSGHILKPSDDWLSWSIVLCQKEIFESCICACHCVNRPRRLPRLLTLIASAFKACILLHHGQHKLCSAAGHMTENQASLFSKCECSHIKGQHLCQPETTWLSMLISFYDLLLKYVSHKVTFHARSFNFCLKMHIYLIYVPQNVFIMEILAHLNIIWV